MSLVGNIFNVVEIKQFINDTKNIFCRLIRNVKNTASCCLSFLRLSLKHPTDCAIDTFFNFSRHIQNIVLVCFVFSPMIQF